MERFKTNNKFLQYQLWQDCRNNCTFCFNKRQKNIDKITSLKYVLERLDDPEVFEYNEVGFIGGEFFDVEIADEEVRKLFYEIFNKVATMHFEKIYLATALIFDMNTYLIPFLNHLKELGILEKVLLCTSYDLKYRFHTPKAKQLWEDNMLKLKELYPELRTHVETILSQFFIDAVNNDEFSISEFCKKFDTRIDYIEPSSGYYYKDKQDCLKDLPDFFPTKSSFIKFLKKTAINNNEIDLTNFLSLELRSSKLYYVEHTVRATLDGRREGDGRCKPLDKTKKYEIGFIDSDDTMQDIVKMLCAMMQE